jgi:hypothetical protein
MVMNSPGERIMDNLDPLQVFYGEVSAMIRQLRETPARSHAEALERCLIVEFSGNVVLGCLRSVVHGMLDKDLITEEVRAWATAAIPRINAFIWPQLPDERRAAIEQWWSTTVRHLVTVDGEPEQFLVDTVYTLRAVDRDEAFACGAARPYWRSVTCGEKWRQMAHAIRHRRNARSPLSDIAERGQNRNVRHSGAQR